MIDDGQQDTKPLPEHAPKDAPPDKPQEGAVMPDTPENLTIRVTALEIWKQTYETNTNARFDNLLTPEQIKTLIQESNREVRSEIADLTASSNRMIETNQQRTETVNGWMDASREAWIGIFGKDITKKGSEKVAPSIFDRMADLEKKGDDAHNRADAATLEVSEMRADHIEAVGRADAARLEYEKLKPLFETLQQTVSGLHAAQEAERLKHEVQRERVKRVTESLQRILTDPRLLFPALAALGGGAVVTPEALKAAGNIIVGVFKLFTGVN